MIANDFLAYSTFPHDQFPNHVDMFVTKGIVTIKEKGMVLQRWVLEDASDNLIFNFEDFHFLNNQLNITFFNHIILCLQRYKPSTVATSFYCIKAILKYMDQKNKDYDIETFFTSALETNSLEKNYTIILRFFHFCDDLGILDLSDSLRTEFLDYKMSYKFYDSVGFDKLENGPLTDIELQQIVDKLRNDTGPCYQRSILWLCILFGLRPSQIIQLKEKDFEKVSDSNYYYLHIPSAKRHDNFRSRLVPRIIENKHLINLLLEVVKQNNNIKTVQGDERPLFFKSYSGAERKNSSALKNTDFSYHINSFTLYSEFNSIVNRLGIISCRTNELIKLTPYRFRYTLATQAILDGQSMMEVAEILDHRTVYSLKHYFKITEDYYKKLNDTVNKSIEFQDFKSHWNGDFIKRSDHEFADNEILLESKITGIGLCGKEGKCAYLPAFNCYSCSFFQAYNDDIHIQAREDMLKIHERIRSNSTGAVQTQAYLALRCNEEIINTLKKRKNE